VYYLELEDYEFLKQHKELNEDKDILNAANYLAYLYQYIKRLKSTTKNTVRKRASTPPTKEILKVLQYLGYEHEATAPLLNLLATFEDDYRNDIISHKLRIAYIVEKERIQTPEPKTVKLLIDALAELKKEYKQKIAEFHILIKRYTPRKYKVFTKSLLEELKLPIKPSDI